VLALKDPCTFLEKHYPGVWEKYCRDNFPDLPDPVDAWLELGDSEESFSEDEDSPEEESGSEKRKRVRERVGGRAKCF